MQRRLRRARVVRRPERRTSPIPILLLAAMPIVFWLGRKSAEQNVDAPPEPIACVPEPCTTSTVGLCPCPPPRKARPKRIEVLPIPKKETPPQETPRFERDPTEETARHLREHASELSQCAPATGARIRVHLEVQIAPAGVVEKVRITNLEPLPTDIAACVDRIVRAMKPPGFDGTTSEIFALTVVL